ncbi:MAG: hypothetical protein AVDCRST_MAG11-321, partial [uncultured Gemmatimonadaceae bacterium]
AQPAFATRDAPARRAPRAADRVGLGAPPVGRRAGRDARPRRRDRARHRGARVARAVRALPAQRRRPVLRHDARHPARELPPAGVHLVQRGGHPLRLLAPGVLPRRCREPGHRRPPHRALPVAAARGDRPHRRGVRPARARRAARPVDGGGGGDGVRAPPAELPVDVDGRRAHPLARLPLRHPGAAPGLPALHAPAVGTCGLGGGVRRAHRAQPSRHGAVRRLQQPPPLPRVRTAPPRRAELRRRGGGHGRTHRALVGDGDRRPRPRPLRGRAQHRRDDLLARGLAARRRGTRLLRTRDRRAHPRVDRDAGRGGRAGRLRPGAAPPPHLVGRHGAARSAGRLDLRRAARGDARRDRRGGGAPPDPDARVRRPRDGPARRPPPARAGGRESRAGHAARRVAAGGPARRRARRVPRLRHRVGAPPPAGDPRRGARPAQPLGRRARGDGVGGANDLAREPLPRDRPDALGGRSLGRVVPGARRARERRHRPGDGVAARRRLPAEGARVPRGAGLRRLDLGVPRRLVAGERRALHARLHPEDRGATVLPDAHPLARARPALHGGVRRPRRARRRRPGRRGRARSAPSRAAPGPVGAPPRHAPGGEARGGRPRRARDVL